MEGLGSPTSFARLVASALGDNHFTLLDIGCRAGIDAPWRVFGERLRAFAFDPNVNEVNRLTKLETNPAVVYIPKFVGLPAGDSGAERMRSMDFWARNPWSRLSVARTQEIRASKPGQVSAEPLADPGDQVIIPLFLRERGVDDVDFIKIDVDGADFLILRTLVQTLEDTKVLGVGIEVNFFGSEDPEVHTFHNVDRLMKQNGFELFMLSTRPYSVAALPAPYRLTQPAQSAWGRIFQGDAIYFRDIAASEQAGWAHSAGAYKLAKLAALFSLTGLTDCAAEILIRFRSVLEPVLDVRAGLEALMEQSLPPGSPVMPYEEYIAEFESDSARFYPALQQTVGTAAPQKSRLPAPLRHIITALQRVLRKDEARPT
jgi:FkbM family methyltransferase